MSVATTPAVDLVVVASDQAADLAAAVRRLHEHVASRGVLGQAGRDWCLVIADHASTDATSAVAALLAAELPGTETVRFDDRLDRKAMRARFAHRPAEVVAFLSVAADTDLDALLAPLTERAVSGVVDVSAAATPSSNTVVPFESLAHRSLSRRNALVALGGVGLAALVAACGSSNKATPAAATATDAPTTTGGANGPATTNAPAKTPATTAAGTAAPAGATALAVEMTQGPYYLNLDLVRSDVREDRKGAALALDLAVVDASGAPIKGAVVDIWHCDADGVYSGFVSASNSSNGGGPGAGGAPPAGGQPGQGGPPPGGQPGQGGPPPGGGQGGGFGGGGQPGQGATPSDASTFLRGTQLADAAGKLTFTTIYPGWYQGRNVHIHVMVHVGGNVVHTGQLFFDDTFTDGVYASTAPYSARPTGRLRNTDDGIFGGGGDTSVLAVTKSGDVYQAAMTMAVKTA